MLRMGSFSVWGPCSGHAGSPYGALASHAIPGKRSDFNALPTTYRTRLNRGIVIGPAYRFFI